MTEKATSNANSWKWASHIRTKQSKWLEHSLQDMEYKVEDVLNLIQKDGDSFARRAEMYYKHRPDVINFVDETFRGYRSLAERYDKLSTELQKANTTIASICPEKVTYEDDDDYNVGPSKVPRSVHQNKTKVPKAPKLPSKDLKGVKNSSTATTKANPSNEDLSKSCEKTSEMLKEKQEKLDEIKQKLESLKEKFNLDQVNDKEENQGEQNELQLGETIDKLANKMISLETSVSSQGVLTDSLRKENDDLQTQIRNLETEKAKLMNQHIQNLEAEKASLMNQKKAEIVEIKTVKNDDVSWLEMLLNGLEDKDDILLEQYISILKSYKDTKKKLSEAEKRNHGTISLMKSAIVKRDCQIQVLKQKLQQLQETFGEDKVDIVLAENEDDILNEPEVVSAVQEKLRLDIEAVLDENLDFLLRFSKALRQVHKFRTQVRILQEEINKVEAKGLAGMSSSSMFTTDLISDIKPIFKRLMEINAKVTAWLEHGVSLKGELQMRRSCLSNIEEKIKFSIHAAKFKGEIMNIKQENNKVSEELEAGLDHAITLKHETEKTLEKLEMKFRLSNNQNQPRKTKGRSLGRKVITLRSLFFGSKSKKQKNSFFSCLGHH